MNIWKISFKNILSKPLYTVLSILMLSLSIGLLLGIQQLKTSFKYQMENNLGGIDLVIGAKGSPLQLVLSSVLHIDNPAGNINYGEAKKIGNNPMIEKTVPISFGDNYKGYKIVGTKHDFLSFYKAEINQGKLPEQSLEVVLGATVANQLNLSIGDTFKSAHGLVENTVDVHDDEFTIVGILNSTQKVIDRLIITNLESIWDVHNHDKGDSHEKEHIHEHENEHDHNDSHEKHNHEDHNREITSLLVSFRSPVAMLTFPRNINQNTNMQAALPKYELEKLYKFTSVGFQTISWIAYIILIISAMTIFISLYKMIKERAFDLALLRTYGASNFQLIKIVSYEAFLVICIAFLVGFGLTQIGMYIAFNVLENAQQLMIIQLPINEVLQIFGLVFIMVLLSVVLAIYPILKMNISTILSNEK